ncbi:hypothetical protein AgCh_035874 [Apium graveolens]
MESSALRQLLQSFCYNSPWKYALFWKFQQHNQMHLTLEEVYCQTPQQRNSVEGILDNIRCNGSHRYSSHEDESKFNNEYTCTDPVELALAYMSSAQHTLADGIVGEVAHSGNYCWASADGMSIGALSFKPQCPDSWVFQFAAGIKTVLLVPVVPHGVLQLGSLNMIAEDQAVVANVKNIFFDFQQLVGRFGLISENMQLPVYSASSIMCPLVDNIMSDRTVNHIKSEHSNEISNIRQLHVASTTNLITQSKSEDISGEIHLEDMLKISTNYIGNDASVLTIYSTEGSEGCVPLYQQLNSNTTDVENRFFEFPSVPEQFHPFNGNMGALGEFATNSQSSSDRVFTTQSPFDKDADNFGTLFSFPKDCELHKALGPTKMGPHSISSRDSPILAEEDYNFSNLTSSGNFNSYTEPAVLETSGPLLKDDNDHMLEFVLGGVDFSLDKNISSSFSNIKSSTATLQPAFPKQQCQSESTLVVNDAEPQSCVTFSVMDRVKKASGIASPSASSFQTMTSELTGEENQKKGRPRTHPRKGSKLSNDSKRRSKAAENQKARPRDRQLIQDRLKELRDLVPDGVKCSIDGLLDRTIQHMMFLRSVTDQADKLRQVIHQEAAQGKNRKSANRNDGQQNGASWAYDLGSEQQLCPIIVEDLEFPGTMLIEVWISLFTVSITDQVLYLHCSLDRHWLFSMITIFSTDRCYAVIMETSWILLR